MMLTLETRIPCVTCGCFLASWAFPTARVSKRSIRLTGLSLIAGPVHDCPECGTSAASDLIRTRWRLTADSAAEVAAYRARRWPDAGTP